MEDIRSDPESHRTFSQSLSQTALAVYFSDGDRFFADYRNSGDPVYREDPDALSDWNGAYLKETVFSSIIPGRAVSAVRLFLVCTSVF